MIWHSVNSLCSYFMNWHSVNTLCSYFMILLSVNSPCSYFMILNSVNSPCSYFMIWQSVNTLCSYFMILLSVNSLCSRPKTQTNSIFRLKPPRRFLLLSFTIFHYFCCHTLYPSLLWIFVKKSKWKEEESPGWFKSKDWVGLGLF